MGLDHPAGAELETLVILVGAKAHRTFCYLTQGPCLAYRRPHALSSAQSWPLVVLLCIPANPLPLSDRPDLGPSEPPALRGLMSFVVVL
jgi:hypothetical protein